MRGGGSVVVDHTIVLFLEYSKIYCKSSDILNIFSHSFFTTINRWKVTLLNICVVCVIDLKT